MNAEKIILSIIEEFPYLRKKYYEDEDYYEGLAHGFYSEVVYKYAKKLLNENNTKELLKLLTYIEYNLSNELNDVVYENIINVSFLENIIYDKENYKQFKKNLTPKLLIMLDNMEKYLQDLAKSSAS